MAKRVPKVVTTAPKRIWLQIADDSYYASEPFPDDHSEITWCEDSVLACEVEYVRSDLFDGLLVALESYLLQHENLLAGQCGDPLLMARAEQAIAKATGATP